MSREIRYCQKLQPVTAYVAGLAEAAALPLDTLLGEQYYSVATEVLEKGPAGLVGTYPIWLQRLQQYNEQDQLDLCLEEDSYFPELPLQKLAAKQLLEALAQEFAPYSQSGELRNILQSFYYQLGWYLNPPQALHEVDLALVGEYLPDLQKALESFYLQHLEKILVLEYKEYVLLLVIGVE